MDTHTVTYPYMRLLCPCVPLSPAASPAARTSSRNEMVEAKKLRKIKSLTSLGLLEKSARSWLCKRSSKFRTGLDAESIRGLWLPNMQESTWSPGDYSELGAKSPAFSLQIFPHTAVSPTWSSCNGLLAFVRSAMQLNLAANVRSRKIKAAEAEEEEEEEQQEETVPQQVVGQKCRSTPLESLRASRSRVLPAPAARWPQLMHGPEKLKSDFYVLPQPQQQKCQATMSWLSNKAP